jgi:DNA-directed RNA polymerase specialized sigma24 family protein
MATLGRDEVLHDAQAYRRELVAHCYKMVGSVHEAEDLVQEAYLRAWRGWQAFEGRSSVRTWLYRTATNLCLTALSHTSRRVLPAGLGPASTDPGTPQLAAVVPSGLWLSGNATCLPYLADHVLTTDTRHIIAITTFIAAALVEQFGFPPVPGRTRSP